MSPCSMNLTFGWSEKGDEVSRRKISDLDRWWRNDGFLRKLA